MVSNDEIRARAQRGTYYVSDAINDPALDLDRRWANTDSPSRRTAHTYFDYVFSGQDISVYIDGMDVDEACIPIMEFAFNIEQQKVPVYGFWSYSYDSIMRGSRLVSGAIRI